MKSADYPRVPVQRPSMALVGLADLPDREPENFLEAEPTLEAGFKGFQCQISGLSGGFSSPTSSAGGVSWSMADWIPANASSFSICSWISSV
jgi:hypothetical protein